MASYKVSYKLLKEQGESIKATAKLLDGYAQRIDSIKSKLGSDEMLSEIRSNLQKLNVQLNESRTVLNVAGELLVKNTEAYNNTEVRQVKKVDSIKAHNRDFYKNPVVVASAGAGGAAAGAAAAKTVASSSVGNSYSASSTTSTIDSATGNVTTENISATIENVTYTSETYTTNEITINSTNIEVADVSMAQPTATMASTTGAVTSDFTASSMSGPAPVPTPVSTSTNTPIMPNIKLNPEAVEGIKDALKVAGAVAGVGVVGAGAGAAAGAIVSSSKKSKDKPQPQKQAPVSSKSTPPSNIYKVAAANVYDPEVELEKALQRVRDLETDDVI